MAVISIFSGTYCHGDEIAGKVAGKLHYELIEQKLYQLTAEKYEMSPDKLLKSMLGKATFLNRLTRDREKNVARIKLILAEMAASDNVVITGPAGHLFPRTIAHFLRVCIIANFDYRVKQAICESSLSEKDAQKLIRKDDAERLEWTSYLFGKPPYDDSLYDIVIPTHTVTVDDTVRTICDIATGEQLTTTERSQKAAEDFVLGARVNLALVEAGHDVEVASANGRVFITINKDVMRMKQFQDELKEAALKVKGVKDVEIRIGQKFQASSMNPWANIEVPPKILLVDDEQEFVQTLSERLQTRNLESSVVYDGEQALEFVKKDEPDVMVLDLMMPGIDGIEVLRRIKRDHPRVEVIILTGHGSKREEELAEDLGAYAYLRKPVDIDLLARVMNEAYQKINRLKGAGQSFADGNDKF